MKGKLLTTLLTILLVCGTAGISAALSTGLLVGTTADLISANGWSGTQEQQDTKENVNWLQSLLYPEHSGNVLKSPPHRVIFIFGELYPEVVCILRNIKNRYFGLFDQESLAPQQAEIEVLLEEWIDRTVSYSEIRR